MINPKKFDSCRNVFTSEPFRGNQSIKGLLSNLLFYSVKDKVQLEEPLCESTSLNYFARQFLTRQLFSV
jgi:hypothetical protein